jgi:hypothetical protein
MKTKVENIINPTQIENIQNTTQLETIQNCTQIDTTFYLTMISSFGVPGPAGISDRILLSRIASGAIGGQRMVIGNANGTISYADTTNSDHLGKVLGMTDKAYSNGDPAIVVREGLIEFNGWSFDVDLPIYLGVNGVLTQSPSSSGFSQIVGFAEAPTKLFINLREPILF